MIWSHANKDRAKLHNKHKARSWCITGVAQTILGCGSIVLQINSKKKKMAAPDMRAEFVCTAPTIQTTENYSSTGILPVDYLAGGT